MDARQRLLDGDPRGALDALKGEIRKAPRDPKLRTFLFQLFCVFGEWDRALSQLTVAAELDGEAIPMAETYRTLIRCEGVREGVFAGTRTPTVFGHPLPWLPALIEANRLLARGEFAAAAALRDGAFDAADAVPGTLDGTAFDWIADADPRLGPVLEAIIDGTYYWVPLQHVAALKVEPPADLRDQVWLPVEFTWTNGGTAIAFIPTRYPASATAADPLLAIGRRTEWVEHGGPDDGWSLGLGQRMFTTGDTDVAAMDLRDLRLATHAPAGATVVGNGPGNGPVPAS